MSEIAIVTGGAGFIGSHMVDCLLKEGFEVRVIDSLVGSKLTNLDHHKGNPKLKVEVRDIRDYQPGDKFFDGVKYVFHFAGIGDIVPSIDKPMEYMSVNVQGTVHMLECARHVKAAKFVYAASSSCFGLAKQLPTPEDAAIVPEYPYALSKYQGEMATLHWGKVYGLPVNSIRMFNVYGTRSRTSGAYGAVFGVFLKQKLAAQPFTVVGDGTQTRDFVYAADVAKAFLAAARSKYALETYNLGAGKPQSVNRLVELLAGPGAQIVHVPKRPGEPDCTWADITKIQKHLGWKQEIPFEEGVSRMLAVIDYWKEAPLWDPKSIAKATEGWFTAFSKRE